MNPPAEGSCPEPEVARWLADPAGVDPEVLVRLSRPGPRYTSYPTAPMWTDAVGADQLAQGLDLADAEGADSPLSLYLHIPFCRAMCTYCGCNMVVARRPERADLYLDRLDKEMALVRAHLPRRQKVAQLHLGGGTPTFLDERQLLRLVGIIRNYFEILPDAELALEIDPVVTHTEQLALLRGLGFNRVSMGVQDFDPQVQRIIGRQQTVEQTRRLHDYARAIGYRGINIDLIYGLPLQRPKTFLRTLDHVLAMGPDRVAVFGYAHVPWMRPRQRRFETHTIPNPVERFRLFSLALQAFINAGYLQIGMDHFARPDDELARARLARRLKRNFQGYTVLPASDMLAFGITAISEVQGLYVQNLKPLAHYYRAVDAGRLPAERGCVISDEDRLRRDVIHGIMCNFYLDLAEVGRAHGVDPESKFSNEIKELKKIEDQGLLRQRGLELELTPLGRVLVRNVAMVFDPYLKKATGDATPRFSKTV